MAPAEGYCAATIGGIPGIMGGIIGTPVRIVQFLGYEVVNIGGHIKGGFGVNIPGMCKRWQEVGFYNIYFLSAK